MSNVWSRPGIPATSYRKERIERLLEELRYEITRGVMENEIDEQLGYQFAVPHSRTFSRGAVWFELRMWPVAQPGLCDLRMSLVKTDTDKDKH